VTRITKPWLQHHQVGVYAAAVGLALAVGVWRPAAGSAVEPFINPVLAGLLDVTVLEVPFVRLRRAFRNVRFVLAALGMNVLVVPIVLVGALMVLLTPCIDYVIRFTELADGDAEGITAATPALMQVQLALLPVSLWLFVGPRVAAVVPVYVAFLAVMPLLARLAVGLIGTDVGESRALVFTSVTRNSLVVLPLALALPQGYALAPAVVVTQTLVELGGVVVLTRVVPRWVVPDAFAPRSTLGSGWRG
jgi:ACR3 family arsenite efflux pump ArsB